MRWKSIMICVVTAGWVVIETAFGQAPVWQRQVQGYLDGVQIAMYHGGTDYTKPVFADLDGDGDGDLYVGEHDGYLNVFENLSGDPPQWRCVTSGLDSIDVGKHCAPAFWDEDADGDLDMFLGEEDGNIWCFRNDGDAGNPIWTFVTQNYASIVVDHYAIPFFHDLDGDHLDDLLVGHNNGGAAYYRNVGSPGAPAWEFQTSFYQGIDLGDKSSACVFDLENDSWPDLVYSALDGEVQYFHNNGPIQNPTFTNMGVIGAVTHNGIATLWDLDGDQDLDLIIGQADGNLKVYANIGTPSAPVFEYQQNLLAFFDIGFYSVPALADMDADGDQDLFVARAQAGIYCLENVGTPDSATWHIADTYYANLNLPGQEALTFADLDADGDLDMLVGCSDGTLRLYRNIGTPQAAAWDHAEENYAGVDVGDNSMPLLKDVDADGDADLLIGAYDGTVHYLRNDGNAAAPNWVNFGIYPGINVEAAAAPALADLDADGDLDLLVGSGGVSGTFRFYRNVGSMTQPLWLIQSALYQGWDFGDYSTPCFGDLNNDGVADLISGCQSGGIWLMMNVGFTYDITISVSPVNPPIVIPPEGGVADYSLRIVNEENSTHFVTIWTALTLPGGEVIGPIDSLYMALDPLTVYTFPRSVAIADSMPSGEYTLSGYVGIYGVIVYSQSGFTFVKEDSLGVKEWMAGFTDPSFQITALHPNPFNAAAWLDYALPAGAVVDVALCDLQGRRVLDFYRGWQPAGGHRLRIEPLGLSSGVYFVRLRAGEVTTARKIVYLR